MNIEGAVNIVEMRSPMSSMMAANSSCFASAAPISLTIASSAARSSVSASSRFVSSNRRAFSRATPMLAASVASRRSSDSSKACWSSRSNPMTPRTRSPATIGTPSHDSAVSLPTAMAAHSPASAPGAQRPGLGVDPRTLVDEIREGDDAATRVVQGDVTSLDLEDGPHAFSDEVDDGLEVELPGEGVADLVDERQLGVALAGLLDGSGPAQCRGDVLADEGQELAVLARVGVLIVLDDDDAQRPIVRPERDAEPAGVVRCGQPPLSLDRTALDQCHVLGQVQVQRLPTADGISRDAARPAGAHRLRDCGVGDVGIQLVHVVGVVEQLALLVVERDVEVLGVHQLAHDGVHGRIELGHLVDRAGGVGDAVEGVLDLQRAQSVELEGLELGKAPPQGGDLRGVRRRRRRGGLGAQRWFRHRTPAGWAWSWRAWYRPAARRARGPAPLERE